MIKSKKQFKYIYEINFNYIASSLILAFVMLFPKFSSSQTVVSSDEVTLGYEDYLKMVIDKNLEFMAEKYNVNIADANTEAAKIFQDPYIAVDWSGTDEEQNLSGEISKSFDFRQKRKARINLAQSERALTLAFLDDYLRNLRADATLDYLNALKQNFLYKVMENSYQTMNELAYDDSIRVKLGSIKAIDAMQSKIEADVLLNELLQLETERNNAFVNLSTKISSFKKDTIFVPQGSFDKGEKLFQQDELLITALNNRADLLAAKNNIGLNQNRLTLTKKERLADLDLKMGVDNTYLNDNKFSNGVGEIFGGIAIPLKFSNLNKGEIKMAQFKVEQAELLYHQVEINIQNEVLQALNQYQSLSRQVANYNQGILNQAKMVLDGKVYSYSRGETSLLEVLNAQRTYNDVQISYYETLYNCHVALVELERAVGIWDIKI